MSKKATPKRVLKARQTVEMRSKLAEKGYGLGVTGGLNYKLLKDMFTKVLATKAPPLKGFDRK